MSQEPVKRHCKSELFNILSWAGGKRYYREEELHSNILGWLFHPQESHGLGGKAAQAFLDKIKAGVSLGDDYTVGRESSKTKDSRYRKADIKIESSGVCVVLENKWNAKMGRKQMSGTCERFSEASKKTGKRYVYIVLARRREVNVDTKTPHILTSYSVVCDVIRDLLPLKNEPAATLLKEYCELIGEKAPKWDTVRSA